MNMNYTGTFLSNPTEISDLKADHLQTLSAPLDAYWEEALIGFSEHYALESGSNRIGYYCINAEKELIAFYLRPAEIGHAENALKFILQNHQIKTVLAGTNDAFYLSTSLALATNTKVHTLLFQDNAHLPLTNVEKDKYQFNLATEKDFDEIAQHYIAASGSIDTESVETGYAGLKGYIKSVMQDHHIFTLKQNGNLLATSECRFSKTQNPYADVGMIVAEKFRRRGIGSYILGMTRTFCHQNEKKPICSCEANNIGSKKAIKNAGFISRNCIVAITVST